MPPVSTFVEKGDVRTLRQLHHGNVQFEAADARLAARLGRVECLAVFYKANVDLNQGDEDTYQTCAHQAAAKGHLKTLQWLGAHGSDLWQRDRAGNTPLHLASMNDETGGVCVFLATTQIGGQAPNLACCNGQGDTPLHMSARNGAVTNLRALMKLAPASTIQLQNGRQARAVDEAREHGHRNCVALLEHAK